MKSRIQISKLDVFIERAKARAGTVFRVLAAALVLVGCAGIQNHASAEVSDAVYEKSLIERKRDFDAYVARRQKSSDKELESALALKKSREAAKLENEKNLENYRKTMVRYSMEVVEERERKYEEELAGRDAENSLERSRFVERRNRQRGIEQRSPTVDPYQEFEINFNVAPESKVSSTGLTGETTP